MIMTNPKSRDAFLDIAKGMAIILVVIGHVIQGSAANFDDLLEFKIIYSFHMPLFIFLSGAVAGVAFDSEAIKRGVIYTARAAWEKIKKALVRLLIPFIAWCILNQLIYEHADGIFSALLLAFRRPDTALWFLLAIFYCIVLVGLFQIFFAFIFKLYPLLKLDRFRASNFLTNSIIQIALMIVLWWCIRGHSPHGAGLGLLKLYFIYYALGMGFYKYTQGRFSAWSAILGFVTYFSLVSFWLRTAPFQYAGPIELPFIAGYFYAGIVAISGIWFFLGCAKTIASCDLKYLKNFLILCGQLSLGIYAIHYFFLPYHPKIIAPLLLSLAISFFLSRIPVLRTIFLGER
jgi:fucose 4-O-acetylase-like acetyltransferase